jgi:Ethanolamine utilization protein EutJ (predicted chaperonin)
MSTLKVDTIQHSGGTTGLTIDSSGRILTPARPAFRAYDASGADHIELTHAQVNTLPFDTTEYNIGSHYNTSTYRFTAPVTGVYYFYLQAYQAKEGAVRYLYIRKNGSTVATSQGAADTNNDVTNVCSVMVQLTSSDYVTPHIYHSADTANSYYSGGGGTYSFFMGYLIG